MTTEQPQTQPQAKASFFQKHEKPILLGVGGFIGLVLFLIVLFAASGGRLLGGTSSPTPTPTVSPSPSPTVEPTPTEAAAPKPTKAPTKAPTKTPTPNPTNAPTNTPTPTTAPFSVTTVTASADPATFSGSCPKQITFTAHITTNAGGTVTYKWKRSDGASSSTDQTVTFAGAGTQAVTTTWTFGSSGNTYTDYWERVEVSSPNSINSNNATFTLTCT